MIFNAWLKSWECVSLGVWISATWCKTKWKWPRPSNCQQLAQRGAVIVGNEAIYSEEVTPEQLMSHLDRMRASVKVPVTTAEQWHVWQEHPELGKWI